MQKSNSRMKSPSLEVLVRKKRSRSPSRMRNTESCSGKPASGALRALLKGVEAESKTEANEEHQEVESNSWGKIHPGASKCAGNNTSGLLEEARRVLSFCRIPQSELARGERAGRGPLRLCRRALSERRGQSPRRQTASSLRVREARSNAQWPTSASTIQEGSERVEKDGAHTGANANGGIHQEQHHRNADTSGKEGDGTLQRGDLFHICSSWRNVQDIPSRCGAPQQHISPRCHSPRSHGAKRKFQGRDLRRNPDSGRHSLSVVGDFDERPCREESVREQGGSATLGFSAQKFLQKWRACVQILEVQDVAHSPYQNRHGGASRDMLLKLRSVQAINQRGRWATDVSARIYSKPGKFQQIINQCSHRLEQLAKI